MESTFVCLLSFSLSFQGMVAIDEVEIANTGYLGKSFKYLSVQMIFKFKNVHGSFDDRLMIIYIHFIENFSVHIILLFISQLLYCMQTMKHISVNTRPYSLAGQMVYEFLLGKICFLDNFVILAETYLIAELHVKAVYTIS